MSMRPPMHPYTFVHKVCVPPCHALIVHHPALVTFLEPTLCMVGVQLYQIFPVII